MAEQERQGAEKGRGQHTHAPTTGTREQITAQEEVAVCACGTRVIQREFTAAGNHYLTAWSAA